MATHVQNLERRSTNLRETFAHLVPNSGESAWQVPLTGPESFKTPNKLLSAGGCHCSDALLAAILRPRFPPTSFRLCAICRQMHMAPTFHKTFARQTKLTFATSIAILSLRETVRQKGLNPVIPGRTCRTTLMRFSMMLNMSTPQPTNQSTDRPTHQPTHQTNQPTKQVNQAIKQSSNQPCNQAIKQATAYNQAVKQATVQPSSQPPYHQSNQATKQQ